MRIISRSEPKSKEMERYCTHCNSKLGVMPDDLRPRKGGGHEALCPVCHKLFPCMTDAEQTDAYYKK